MDTPYLRTERLTDGNVEVVFIDNGKSIRFVVPPLGSAGDLSEDEIRQALEEARAASNAFCDFVTRHLNADRT